MGAWFTVAEAAQYAGVSRDTIYTACERRKLRHAHVDGRRAIRVRPQWIDAWLERHAPEVQDERIPCGKSATRATQPEVAS
jgi:excisionase family DNA binding protein